MNILQNKFIDYYATDQQLTQDTRTSISSHLSVVDLSKNQILIKENRRHDYAYFVIKGAVRSYYLKDGIEVNTWFAFENEIVGSLQNFKGNPSRETMELLEDSTLIAINLRELKPLMMSNIQIANFINNIIQEYALFLEDRIYYSQMMSSMEKYHFILEHEPYLFQRIPLTYIASYLGIARETLSRLRAK
jgi:CRP-like cAMP-binding protein